MVEQGWLVEGDWPSEPKEHTHMYEYPTFDGGVISGPAALWAVSFDKYGDIQAVREADYLLLTEDGMRRRWGQWFVDEFDEIVRGHFDHEPDPYDSWVTAMERTWEAQEGK